jgi:hypothetical protein
MGIFYSNQCNFFFFLAHKIYPREWQEIGVSKKSPKNRVPQNVPPLGRQLNENAESDNARFVFGYLEH